MFKLSMGNLARNKLRTLLSVLGIVIGVASLIVLVSVVDGLRSDISDAISQAQGARVTPLNSSDPIFSSMDESWAGKIEGIQGVKAALPNIMQLARSVEDKPSDITSGTRIIGLTLSNISQATGSGVDGEILEGRDFTTNDSGKFVAMIGKPVKDNYNKFIGSKIKVNGESLRVIGVYTTGSDLLDNSILMPIETIREITGFPKDKVSFINVQLNNPAEDKRVVDRINLLYGDEIKAATLSDFSSQFGEIFNSVTLLVAAIASIASIVAAVGIINTMLMSVLERFKEIGALKAVGWTNGNIMAMILIESLLVGLLGGVLGAILGLIGAFAVDSFGLTTVVTTELLIGSVLGAVLVGVLGGIYPAFIASRMDPVEALRAE
ncbi:MAG: ABC transporter permease [archaeon]|nr:ABC transporter permease [archaeon]